MLRSMMDHPFGVILPALLLLWIGESGAGVQINTDVRPHPSICVGDQCGQTIEDCSRCHVVGSFPADNAGTPASPLVAGPSIGSAISLTYTSVTTSDGILTVEYPASAVPVGQEFYVRVTTRAMPDGYWYGVDDPSPPLHVLPWFDVPYTNTYTYRSLAAGEYSFIAGIDYCSNLGICGGNYIAAGIRWTVTVGPSASIIDNVPYYNQGSYSCDEWYGRLHPEQTRKAEPCIGGGPWASDIYDGTSQSVRSLGCAITSAVMVIRKLGVEKVCYDNNYVSCSGEAFNDVANWRDVNPRTLNEWAKRNGGYDSSGGFKYIKVLEYTNYQIELYKKIDSKNDNVLNLALGLKLPPVVALKYFNPTDSKIHEHRVVATGQTTIGGSSTWTINDPGHFEVENLLGCYRNSSGVQICYDNTYFNLRIFRPHVFSEGYSALEIHLASPAEFLLTDPTGRRAGFDPLSGMVVNEIPDFEYGPERIDDAETGELGHEIKVLYIGQPLSGAYDVNVIGTGSGAFNLSMVALDNTADETFNAFTGTTAPSRVYDYRIDYSAAVDFPTIVTAITYQFLGFQPPIQMGGSKVFKLGSTIPVKFQVKRRDGAPAQDVTATLALQRYTNGIPVGDPIDASPTGGSDSGNVFRYDPQEDQYIYNLSTRALSVGTWKLIVTLDDGSAYDVLIGLK